MFRICEISPGVAGYYLPYIPWKQGRTNPIGHPYIQTYLLWHISTNFAFFTSYFTVTLMGHGQSHGSKCFKMFFLGATQIHTRMNSTFPSLCSGTNFVFLDLDGQWSRSWVKNVLFVGGATRRVAKLPENAVFNQQTGTQSYGLEKSNGVWKQEKGE